MEDTHYVGDQRGARRSSPNWFARRHEVARLPCRLASAAGVEQPKRQPDRHNHHRAGQEDAPTLTDVGKFELEPRHSARAAFLNNEAGSKPKVSRIDNERDDDPLPKRPRCLLMTDDLDWRIASAMEG